MGIKKTKFKNFFFSVLAISTLNFSSVYAHHGGTSSINGANLAGPVVTLSAETLGQGKFFLGAGVDYANYNQFSSSKIRSLNKRKETSENLGDTLSPFIAGGYGLSDRLSILFNYPYNIRYDIEGTEDGSSLDHGNSIGFGDLTVLGQFKYYENEAKDFKSSIFAGLKFPTGQTDRKGKSGEGHHAGGGHHGGERHHADHQPGTGSWDPVLGLAFTKIYKNISYHASASYKLSTEGVEETTVGDVFNYGVAAAHRLREEEKLFKFLPKHLGANDLFWDLIFEINGQWTEKVAESGFKEEGDHGGHLLFLTPALRLIINNNWVANFSSSLKVQDALNGVQSSPDLQLGFSLNRVF